MAQEDEHSNGFRMTDQGVLDDTKSTTLNTTLLIGMLSFYFTGYIYMRYIFSERAVEAVQGCCCCFVFFSFQ